MPVSRSTGHGSTSCRGLVLPLALALAVAAAAAAAPALAQGGTPRDVEPSSRAAPPAAQHGPVRLPPELPLRRDDDPDVKGGARGALVALLLAVIGAAGWWRWRGRDRGALGGSRAGRWLQERLGSSRSPAPVRVVQSTHLTPRATVHVLHWDDREWLVGCTEHGVTVLGQRARPEEELASGTASPGADTAGEDRT